MNGTFSTNEGVMMAVRSSWSYRSSSSFVVLQRYVSTVSSTCRERHETTVHRIRVERA